MNANTAKVQSIIETTFTSAIDKLIKSNVESLISDLYVQVDAETGELSLFDDNENQLGKVIIFDWMNQKGDEEALNKRAANTLKAVLTALSTKGIFDDPHFIRPLSISLTDESFIVIEELLFLDDDLFRLDDPLLKDLDEDLNNFLNNLLSDIN